MFTVKKMNEIITKLSDVEIETFRQELCNEEVRRKGKRNEVEKAFWDAAKKLYEYNPYYEFGIFDEEVQWLDLETLLSSAGQI